MVAQVPIASHYYLELSAGTDEQEAGMRRHQCTFTGEELWVEEKEPRPVTISTPKKQKQIEISVTFQSRFRCETRTIQGLQVPGAAEVRTGLQVWHQARRALLSLGEKSTQRRAGLGDPISLPQERLTRQFTQLIIYRCR